MNQERKEELIVKWVDDALTTAEQEEVAKLLEAEPEWRSFKEGHLEVRHQIQAAYPTDADVPYGDFFSSRLQRAIAEDSVSPAEKSKPSLWSQFLRWGAAPAMAAALAVAFLAGTQVQKPEVAAPEFVYHPEVYTPAGGVSASYASLENTGTVILLDGLEAIPESVDLIAKSSGVGAKAELVSLVSPRSL